MIGRVSIVNVSRKFALLTPLGKSRDHDIFAAEVQFWVAGCTLPFRGQIVRFDIAHDRSGLIEAVNISELPPTVVSNAAGAVPVLRSWSPEAPATIRGEQ